MREKLKKTQLQGAQKASHTASLPARQNSASMDRGNFTDVLSGGQRVPVLKPLPRAKTVSASRRTSQPESLGRDRQLDEPEGLAGDGQLNQ